MAIDLPRGQLVAVQELAVRLLESRKTGIELDVFAREILVGFATICTYAGQDRVLGELAAVHEGVDVDTPTGFADHDALRGALVEQLRAVQIDGGGPRNAKPRQVGESVVAALGLTVVDDVPPLATLGDDVRNSVAAAIGKEIEAGLAVPAIREAIIIAARTLCTEDHLPSFEKIVPYLDERGSQLTRHPKVPIDALHASKHALAAARMAVVGRVARAALARALPLIAAADAEAAGRIDTPVTLKGTPRELAVLRATDPRVGPPVNVTHVLVESLAQLLKIAWSAPDQIVIPYGASKTFAMGDVIEHPKFGRGPVTGMLASRIDVEFPTGKVTLIHVPPRR